MIFVIIFILTEGGGGTGSVFVLYIQFTYFILLYFLSGKHGQIFRSGDSFIFMCCFTYILTLCDGYINFDTNYGVTYNYWSNFIFMKSGHR
jgi:hypothetical protein